MTIDERTQTCLNCCWSTIGCVEDDDSPLPRACCPIEAAKAHDLSFEEIRPLMRLCEALGWSPGGFVWAVEQTAERRRVAKRV